jgi:hypothetical protein
MQVDRIIRAMIDRSSMSANAFSAALGKSREWARMTARPGRDPKLGTVADVADVAGCDVCIIDRETEAVVATVTPPRRAAS